MKEIEKVLNVRRHQKYRREMEGIYYIGGCAEEHEYDIVAQAIGCPVRLHFWDWARQRF